MHPLHQNPEAETPFSCPFGTQDHQKPISKYAQKNYFSIVLTLFLTFINKKGSQTIGFSYHCCVSTVHF